MLRIPRRGACVLLTAVALCACAAETERPPERENLTATQKIIAAQERLTETVLTIPGVVGTAVGETEGELCIKVMVARRTPEIEDKIPPRFEGYKVILQETGVIRKRSSR